MASLHLADESRSVRVDIAIYDAQDLTVRIGIRQGNGWREAELRCMKDVSELESWRLVERRRMKGFGCGI